jgi:large subunit ribosomal protein L19e
MKLEKKKAFVAKVLGIGQARIIFNTTRLNDIKEAITRQDVRELVAQKAIIIRNIIGRKTIVKNESRRRAGSVRKRAVDSKRQYIIITRKLRSYLSHMKIQGKLTHDQYAKLRREIRARGFKSLAQMKECIEGGI